MILELAYMGCLMMSDMPDILSQVQKLEIRGEEQSYEENKTTDDCSLWRDVVAAQMIATSA